MSVTTVASAAGKYLTFELAEEAYGLPIMRVQEIVGMLPVTRVPRLPEFIAGVVNLRGRVVPVVNLRLTFGLPKTEPSDRTCIVIVQIERPSGAATMGVMVDAVSDVVNLGADAIEETPEFGTAVDTSFITGVGRADNRVVLLLDIDQVLSGEQLHLVQRAADTGEEQPAPE